ncbi:sigma-70 family RNA polymerase sigma factor [uncultured Parvimonas sp.]|uniref:RNA polymerase sigma factor n=1 Tax=uncultured Parvimonas sp. TaxID=747372 RepID=UPI00288A01CD|nr:sigma-70 family RNA polymerase sigma factor [uncultured Parvimonas sp.]
MILKNIFSSKNEDLLEYLYEEYKQIMYYIALKILKNPADAEDAVSDAFLKVIHHLNKIDKDNSKKTKAFLILIVKSVAIDMYRRKSKTNTIPIENIDHNLTTYSVVENFEEIDEFKNAMNKLSFDYSNILILKYHYGFDDKEISKILNISKNNVRQRISRAKKKLKNILEKEGEDDE